MVMVLRRRRLHETGENCDWSSEEGWNGRGTWHEWGKEELRKEIDYLEDLGLDVRIILG